MVSKLTYPAFQNLEILERPELTIPAQSLHALGMVGSGGILESLWPSSARTTVPTKADT
jgi:hypothetical protein